MEKLGNRINLGGPLQRNSHKNNISQSESHKVFNRISQEMLSKMNEKGHVLKHIAKKFQNPRVKRKTTKDLEASCLQTSFKQFYNAKTP